MATPLLSNLAESSRRAILEHLTSGPKSVNELVALTGLSQPNVSNHLSRMRSAGAVHVTQLGRVRVYELVGGIPQAALLTPSPAHAKPLAPSELKEQSAKFFTALLEADSRAAWKVVHDCIQREATVVPLYEDVMEPALRKIGDWYEQGRISEADEHLATSLTERLMAYAANSVPVAPFNGSKAILGAVAGNYHVVGLRMIADAMQQLGWDVRYLGANVPTPSFVKMIQVERPQVVLASASAQEQAREAELLGQQFQALRSQGLEFKFGLGGRAVSPVLLQASKADFTGRSLRDVLKTIEKFSAQPGTTQKHITS